LVPLFIQLQVLCIVLLAGSCFHGNELGVEVGDGACGVVVNGGFSQVDESCLLECGLFVTVLAIASDEVGLEGVPVGCACLKGMVAGPVPACVGEVW